MKAIIFTPTTGVVYPFTSEIFQENWALWLAFRKEIKKPIRGVISEQGQLKKLAKMSNGNEHTAAAIIEQSISNNWQGLFAIKNQSNGVTTTDSDLGEALKRRFATNN